MTKYEIAEIILLVFSILISIVAMIVSVVQSKKSNDIANNANEKAELANRNAQEANELSEKANEIANNANFIAKESVVQNKKLSLLSERKRLYFDINSFLIPCDIIFNLWKINSLPVKISKDLAVENLNWLLACNCFDEINKFNFSIVDKELYEFCCKKIKMYKYMSIDSEFLFNDEISKVLNRFLNSYFFSIQYNLDIVYYQTLYDSLNENVKSNLTYDNITYLLELRQNDASKILKDLEKYFNIIKKETVMDKMKEIIKIDVNNKESNND